RPARGAIGGADEAGVAAATAGAASHQHALTGLGQVSEPLPRVAVGNYRTEGHPEDRILAGGAVLVRALAVLPTLGGVVAVIVEGEERGDGGIGLEKDAPPVASVSTVRAAAGNELLSAEADAARTPVAALDEDVDFVDEHQRPRGRRARLGGLLGDA